MSPEKPTGKLDRDSKRQSLITAAKTLFSAKGYHATTVDDITRAAGVAKGTFYLYFSEKREIYYKVIGGFMQLIMDIGNSVGQTNDMIGETPPDALDYFSRAEAAAHELMNIFIENRELVRLAYRESMGLDPRLEQMIRDFYREIAEVEARNIQIAIDLKIIRKATPLLVAYAHIGIVERVLLAMLDSPEDFPAPEEIVREMLQLGFAGLRLLEPSSSE